MQTRSIAIVVPARNEERHIRDVLLSLLPSGVWPFRWSVTVADGSSDDATAAIARRTLKGVAGSRVIDNPRRLQSVGVNLAVRSLPADCEVVVRADAHAAYPPDFVRQLVRRLDETGADSVVVPMISRSAEGSFFGYSTAAAQNGLLGNGGSRHRNAGGASGFVGHGHHAAFKRLAFDRVGGYDETFTHNEDAEFDERFRAAGLRIWLAGDLPVTYFVRETPADLARQYWNHGRGRARTFRKHGTIALRQILPAAVFAANAGSVLLAPLVPMLLWIPMAYASGCLLAGALAPGALPEKMSGIPAAIMHNSWGAGFVWEMASGWRRTT